MLDPGPEMSVSEPPAAEHRRGIARWAIPIAVVAALLFGGLLVLGAASGFVQSLANGAGWSWDNRRQAQVQVVLLALGGAIAIVGVGFTASRHVLERREGLRATERLSLERQRQDDDRKREETRRDEVAAQATADRERVLRDRFVTIAGLLDSSSPMTRLAGITQLASLSDDWVQFGKSTEVQTCVDMLCGYLRTPWDREDEVEASVRRSGIEQIEQRTKRDAGARSWSRTRIDLSGAVFELAFTIDRLENADLRVSSQPFSGLTVNQAVNSVITVSGKPEEAILEFWLQVGSMQGGALRLTNTSDLQAVIDRIDESVIELFAAARVNLRTRAGSVLKLDARMLTDSFLDLRGFSGPGSVVHRSKGVDIDLVEYLGGNLRMTRVEGTFSIAEVGGLPVTIHHTSASSSEHIHLSDRHIVVADSAKLTYDLTVLDEEMVNWLVDGPAPRLARLMSVTEQEPDAEATNS